MSTSAVPWFRAGLIAAFVLVLLTALAHARCDPTTDPDASDVANARAAVAAGCDCAAAATHGAYVRCAAQQVNATLVNRSCASAVKRCASRSTCGRRTAVTCCVPGSTGTKCAIKKDAAHCEAKQGTVGTCTSCCDACGGSGTGPSCEPPTTTSTTTTTTSSCPPATALYCGREGCGSIALCPAGMTCTDFTAGCTCVGPAIACADIVTGLSTEQCHWGTCPAGMMCGAVPRQGACGYDCACQ